MPTAGDEGYEKLVICPYDKSHEIRRGRMQFHLEKCRRNFPNSQLASCPYNKAHIVPNQELEFHMEEECESRATWDRFSYEVTSTVECPVKDLVPVNAATVPDGDENWDNFEASGSVLSHIRAEAEEKPILRMLQVASKSKRKAFRQQERSRHKALEESQKSQPVETVSDTFSVISNPLPRPKIQTNISVVKQDPSKAVAAINKQFRTLDLNMKVTTGDVAPSETSSLINWPPSEYESASTSRQTPLSYTAASHPGGAGRPASVMSNSSAEQSCLSMRTARTSMPSPSTTASRPSSAMSNATSTSYVTASPGGSVNRPPSVMSDSSMSSVVTPTSHRPPNSSTSRQTAAMSIAASAASYNRAKTVDEEGFCQIPIPGLGRGRRRAQQ